MARLERVKFSGDGRYFCCYGVDGKLRVWEGESGVLKQEYTPNLHLSTTCTCLVWMRLSRVSLPKKKRKLKSVDRGEDVDVIVVGTFTGNILFYCLATGELIGEVKEDSKLSVNSLSWTKGCNLFSCAGEFISEWRVSDKSKESTWKAGPEVIKSILVIPEGKYLLSAAQSIKLWSLPEHQLLKTFVGHVSDVIALEFVPPSANSDMYFISTAKSDTYISAWNLNISESKLNTAVAQFVVNDEVRSLNLSKGTNNNPTTMCAVTCSGMLHLYQLQLNGKCPKPIKPNVTVQIASRTSANQSKETVRPIPILGIHLYDYQTLFLAHGFLPLITFERITPDFNEKVICLVRKVRSAAKPQPGTSKTVDPSMKVIECTETEAIEYTDPLTAAVSLKRGRGKADVPMEERLENLTLNKPEQGVPQVDSVAHLLVQGLQSKDKRLLQNVLLQQDENVIKRTVARLPVQIVIPLVQELSNLIYGNVIRCRSAAQWLRAVLIMHAGQLLANTSVIECLAPVLELIEVRLTLAIPLARLRGRMDLLLEQIQSASSRSSEPHIESLLVHQDGYSSGEESLADEIVMNSESDDNWEEHSEDEQIDSDEGQSEEQDVEFNVENSD